MMLKLRIALLSMLAFPAFLLPGTAMAVDVFPGCESGAAKNSAVCQDADLRDAEGNEQNPLFGKNGILTIIINILSIIIGIVAIIVIIVAGLRFITSGTNPQDVNNARERVIYAAIALVIAGLAQVLVRFIIGKVG